MRCWYCLQTIVPKTEFGSKLNSLFTKEFTFGNKRNVPVFLLQSYAGLFNSRVNFDRHAKINNIWLFYY